MIVNSYHDIKVFSLCLLCGSVTGLIFDFFRSLRKSVTTGKNMTAFQDALFCAIAFYLFTKTVDLTNNGDLRWYEFAGMFFGLAVYFLWMSKFFCFLMTKLCMFIVKIFMWLGCILKKLISCIIYPFLYFGRLIHKISKSFIGTVKRKYAQKNT